MNRAAEQTIFYLKELGFTEYEAEVYICLLDQHPATAYTISQTSGVPHSRVYDITRRLIKKGFALLAAKNPERFSPLAPGELISKLKKDHSRYLDDLDALLDQIEFTSDFDPVWNISHPEEALEITRQLIEQAKHQVYIGVWDAELEELLDHLRAAHQRGVEIVCLVYGEKEPDFGEAYHHRTRAIKGLETMGRTIDCVVDSAGCLSGSLGASQPCQVVWTRNQGLVKSIEEYIIHDFYIAEIENRFGAQLETEFGKNLTKLREKYGR
jgi:sugar-specific transcriptional regulator TrmB